MDIISILISLALGALAGWSAGKLMNSDGSILRNIILGIVGGVVASIIFGLIGISFSGYLGTIIVSIIGACLLIWLARLVTKK